MTKLASWQRFLGFFLYVGVFFVIFRNYLFELIGLSLNEELYSHIILIPVIFGYLFFRKRHEFCNSIKTSVGETVIYAFIVLALLILINMNPAVFMANKLCIKIACLVLLFIFGGLLFFGSTAICSIFFPVGFLVFLIPIPKWLEFELERFSQNASAEIASWFFRATSIPLRRDGVIFELPGIIIRVAEECSGIRSSFMLLITSFVAAYLMLRTAWARVILTAAIVPIGILRNGFRIWMIGWLCVRYGPEMIESAIHRRGGPLFFLISLCVLLCLLHLLCRFEKRRAAPL